MNGWADGQSPVSTGPLLWIVTAVVLSVLAVLVIASVAGP
jgi:hypothetical protein